MSTVMTGLVLGLGLTLAGNGPQLAPPLDPAVLREMLYDPQHPRNQAQAALLLVQGRLPEMEEIVRHGLRQSEAVEVFLALASAIRMQRDGRFGEELVAALKEGIPPIRQAAATVLAELADDCLLARLQAILDDPHSEPAARQAAVWTLGRCAKKTAVVVLLDQLSQDNEAHRRDVADALAELTGLNYGTDLARWRAWWLRNQGLSNEQWLEQRLSYQASRTRRLEGDLERSKAQVVRLHQLLYARLPPADRLGHVLSLVEHEDPAVRGLAVAWSLELWATADAVGQRTLTDLLLRLSRDSQTEVQRNAVLALARAPDPRVFERLRLLLEKGSAPVRAAAARALAQQARGTSPEALARQRQVVPALQKALDDPALEVVLEAAEDLGALGVPEAGPVLSVLLRHPSDSVRQTAAQALERVAEPAVLKGLLEVLDDPQATVRFHLLGAVARALRGGNVAEEQRHQALARLETLLARDTDPGVRSRAATVLGECGSPAVLAALWKRLETSEDSRVQEKAWNALVEILARSARLDLVSEWEHTLAEAGQGPRRLALLTEIAARWQKRDDLRQAAATVQETLAEAHLQHNRWSAAWPLVRELLARSGTDADLDRRLRLLLGIGHQALRDGNRSEVLRMVQEARPHLTRRKELIPEFEQLERQAQGLPEGERSR